MLSGVPLFLEGIDKNVQLFVKRMSVFYLSLHRVRSGSILNHVLLLQEGVEGYWMNGIKPRSKLMVVGL